MKPAMDVGRCNYALINWVFVSVNCIDNFSPLYSHCMFNFWHFFLWLNVLVWKDRCLLHWIIPTPLLHTTESWQHCLFYWFSDALQCIEQELKKKKMGKSVAECLLPSSYFTKMNLPASGRAGRKCTLKICVHLQLILGSSRTGEIQIVKTIIILVWS